METKICSMCKQEKLLSEFSFQTRLMGGERTRHARCKECISIWYREWYAKHGRGRSENYSEIVMLWSKSHPESVRVRGKVAAAIKRGELSRPLLCSICGRVSRINAHHNDYDKPFEILWVCSSCHKRIHLGLLPA